MKKLLCAVSLVTACIAGSAFADTQLALLETDPGQMQSSKGLDVDNQMVLAYQFMRPDGVIVSNICNTPYGSCMMPVYGPIVGTCWCPGPYGPVAGTPGG